MKERLSLPLPGAAKPPVNTELPPSNLRVLPLAASMGLLSLAVLRECTSLQLLKSLVVCGPGAEAAVCCV